MALKTHTDFLTARGLLGMSQSQAALQCKVSLSDLQRCEHLTYGPAKVDTVSVDKIKAAFAPLILARIDELEANEKARIKLVAQSGVNVKFYYSPLERRLR